MSSFLPAPIVRIVVCGNADRGDDGVALATIARLLPTLPHRLLAKVEIRRCLELRVEDLVDLKPGVSCLIVDAVLGPEPGQVVCRDLSCLLERQSFTPRSSHELPMDLVLGLAGVLRDEPVAGTFVGLCGHGFDYGAPLSRVVRSAMPAFRDAITAELEKLAFPDAVIPGSADTRTADAFTPGARA